MKAYKYTFDGGYGLYVKAGTTFKEIIEYERKSIPPPAWVNFTLLKGPEFVELNEGDAKDAIIIKQIEDRASVFCVTHQAN